MARRMNPPSAFPPGYSAMSSPAHYQTLNLDIDSTDPYGLGSPQRQHAASPPPLSIYSARSLSPPPQMPSRYPRSHTPHGVAAGSYTEATEDLAAMYAAPRYDTPAPPTFAYDEKSFDDEKAGYLAPPLSRRPTGAKASRATSHSGQEYDSEEDEEQAYRNIHVGPAPEKVTRRNQTTKRVVLTNGNVVLDCPVPTRLRGFLPRKDHEEFVFMRYVLSFPHLSSLAFSFGCDAHLILFQFRFYCVRTRLLCVRTSSLSLLFPLLLFLLSTCADFDCTQVLSRCVHARKHDPSSVFDSAQ